MESQLLKTMIVLALFLGISHAWGASIDDARKLKAEADETLRKASGMSADPKLYADAVRKLEKASDILEEIAKTNPKSVESMQEELSSALFWAKRFANVQVADELNHTKKDTPTTPVKAPEPAPAGDQAEKEFHKAEEFEALHKGDDHGIALRWFQVADKYSGTDWSLRALQRAQEAQSRFRASQRSEKKDETPDAKLIAEGDALMQQKNPEGALKKFLEARKVTDTVLAERRIGNAHLTIGYKGRNDYAKQYLPLQTRYQEALKRGARVEAEALKRQAMDLVNRLKPLEDSILRSYADAQTAFQRGLDLAKSKDLDCEAHLAILQFEKKNRTAARPMLNAVLDKYPPANDEDRTIVEYCKSLLRLMGG